MANPQKENGYTTVANEIAEALFRFPLGSEESRLVWFVLRYTYGFNRKSATLAISFIAKGTGLKRSAVSRGLRKLATKRLLVRKESTVFFNKNYDSWVATPRLPQQPSGCPPSNNVVAQERKQYLKKTNYIASPPATPVSKEIKKKEPTKLQEVVDHFFVLQEVPDADRKVAYPRHVRDGRDLLKACGDDPKKAKAVLDALHAWAASKKLTYTIGTALKRWKDFSGSEVTESWDDKMKRVEAEVEKYKSENGII